MRQPPLTLAEFEEAVGKPLSEFAHECHAASLALVKARLWPVARVARGACLGVGGQHSWVVLSHDVYDPNAWVIDPTRWSYTGKPPHVEAHVNLGLHQPHGCGYYINGGRPYNHGGDVIELAVDLGPEAQEFLRVLGPLDARGWIGVANLPMQGWPAREIIEAMLDTPQLRAFVPIDIAGMVTDRNPGGLYLAEEATS